MEKMFPIATAIKLDSLKSPLFSKKEIESFAESETVKKNKILYSMLFKKYS